MMNLFAFFLVFSVIMLANLYIGVRAAKNDTSTDDYFLSSRNLGVFSLTATILATQIGGGTIIGASQEAYEKGFSVILYPMGVVLGLLFLSVQIGKTQRNFKLSTISEIFELCYRSKLLRKVASFICILSLTSILIGQGIAAKKFFISMGFSSNFFFLIFWAIVIIYTAFGGLKAVVQTDIFQAIFMFSVLAITFLFLIFQSKLNIDFSTISASESTSAEVPYFSWLFMPMLYMLIEQDMAQRCFAAKNSLDIPKACRISALLVFLCVVPAIVIGLTARANAFSCPDTSCMLTEFISTTCPPSLSILFNCAILVAVISTADSLICSISSLFVYDFFRNVSFKGVSEIRFAQLFTLVLGIFCMLASLYFNDVVFMLILAYEMAVCSLLASIFMALVKKSTDQKAAYQSIAIGFIIFAICKYVQAESSYLMLAIASSFLPFMTSRKKQGEKAQAS